MERGAAVLSLREILNFYRNMLKQEKTGRGALRVTDCHNLRPVTGSDGDVLCAVGSPRVIADSSWSPLGLANGSLLVHNGTTIGYVANGSVTVIATLPAPPTCVHTSQRYATIMTAAGQYLLRCNDDGTFTALGTMPHFGGIAVTAQYVDTYSSTIESCNIANVTSAVCTAYREIVEGAQLGGAFVQPVVARCRLLDSDGNVLHTTPPVAVMLPGGAPLITAWRFGSDDGGTTVRSETVSADAYRLRVTVANTIPAEWQKIVQTLEVLVTPQFHPIDFAGTATIDLGRASSTDKYVRVTLPGAERGLSPIRPIQSAELLKRAVERFDTIAECVARIANPFAGGVDKVLSISTLTDVSTAANNMTAALATSAPAQVSTPLARMLTPHSFTANGVAWCGDTAVWTNVKPLRFGGYPAAAYAATFESKAYTGYTTVTFANGERVVTPISGDCAPLTLSPLIAYPSAEAASITIAIKVDGETTMRTFSADLTADASGRFAIYTSPTFAPIAMTAAAVTSAPTAVSADLSMPGYVAVTTGNTIPAVTAVASVGNSITTVIAARSGSSAWEYKRTRIYAFCTDGIKLLTVSAAKSECAVNLLDCRVIANAHCAADGGNVVYALADNEVLQVSANAVKTIARNADGDRIARLSAYGEIVIANTADNHATHYCLNYGNGAYTTTLAATGAWLAANGTAYAATADGLLDLAQRNDANNVDVRWTAVREANSRARRLPSSVCWQLKASAFAGTLSVERAWLTQSAPAPQTVARLTVNGAIASPIKCRLHGHAAIDLTLDMQATVSSDFTITKPTL